MLSQFVTFFIPHTPSYYHPLLFLHMKIFHQIGNDPSWGLIAGILSLILPLGLCCACCLYRLLW
jgi:hypothetical protein